MAFYTTTDPKIKKSTQNMPIFAITTLDPATETLAKSNIEYQKANDVKQGMTISKTLIRDTTLNGLKFYSLTLYEINNKTKETTTNIYGFLFTNSKAIIFLGSNPGKNHYTDALLKTFYSMRL